MKLTEMRGFTIDDIYTIPMEDQIETLKEKNINIARLVVDSMSTDYLDACDAIQGAGICVMLQLWDSFDDNILDAKEFDIKMRWLLKNFWNRVRYVEVANEIGPRVSVNWTSHDQLTRAMEQAKLWVGKRRVVTLFWDKSVDLNLWWEKNKFECEYVMLSFYPREMDDLIDVEKYIPSLASGLSECGPQEWGEGCSKWTTMVEKINEKYKSVIWWPVI